MGPTLQRCNEALKEVLANHSITNPPELDVAFALDVSSSFHGTHTQGTTQKLLERLIPWGMTFSPDKKLDVFTFSDGKKHAVHVGEITPKNYGKYIFRNIIHRVAGYNGGTDYQYIIKLMLKHYGWSGRSKGLFSGMFGNKEALIKRRSVICVVTDGDNFDQYEAFKVLRDSDARKDQVYFLFIAVGTKSTFPFLMQVAHHFTNIGLVVIRDLPGFLKQDNETVHAQLIGDDLVAWLKQS